MAAKGPQLAWLGLGNMGRGMCKNLVEKGKLDKPLIIYNRSKKRADELANSLGTEKVKVASSIDDAVEAADIVFICVGDDAAVKEMVEAALQFDVQGKLIVDCSSVHPDTTEEVAQSITKKGAQFVACPVFGAPAAADAGELVAVLAGPPPAVDMVKPFTKGVMARENIDLSGQKHGKATLLKLVGNSFVIQTVEALAESYTLAEKSSCGVDNLRKVIGLLYPGPLAAYSDRMLSGQYHEREEPLFAVDLAAKDVRHALSFASENGAKMPTVETIADHLVQVKEHMGARGDITGIYGAVRENSKLKFENK